MGSTPIDVALKELGLEIGGAFNDGGLSVVQRLWHCRLDGRDSSRQAGRRAICMATLWRNDFVGSATKPYAFRIAPLTRNEIDRSSCSCASSSSLTAASFSLSCRRKYRCRDRRLLGLAFACCSGCGHTARRFLSNCCTAGFSATAADFSAAAADVRKEFCPNSF